MSIQEQALSVQTTQPTAKDLASSEEQAREKQGQPVILSWKTSEDRPTFLLTITYGPGASQPTWILHAGTDADAAIVWIYTTTDFNQIDRMITQACGASGPSNAEVKPAAAVTTRDITGSHNVSNSPMVKPDSEFSDNYEIMDVIGHGGMGMVYKARRNADNQMVALKILHPHLLADNISKVRFEQEAEAARGLKHRNLIDVYEFGFSASGQPFLAMEFLEGDSLSNILSTKGHLPINQFISIFHQICEGLQHAHEKHVIHRDIKPSNIMVCKTESGGELAKIVDFGIAKMAMEGSRSQLTPTGDALGSPAYMSPEQCAGAPPAPASDIYSLGCVMYEAVSGQLPFDHSSPLKIILMQISEAAKPFSKVCPELGIPGELERIIFKALEKDPARRYQNCEDLGRDIWGLTVMAGTGAVRVFGGDLKRAGSIDPPQDSTVAIATADVDIDAIKLAGKSKRPVTLRFTKLKSPFDKEVLTQTLSLGLRMIKKGADLAIFLDIEAVHLAHKSELMSPDYHPDLNTTEKILGIQRLLERVMENGGQIMVNERWAKFWGVSSGGVHSLLPGTQLLNEDSLADFLVERSGSYIDY